MPDAPTLVLLVIMGVMALALMAATAGLAFNIRAQRMPAATQYEDVRERLAVADRMLAERQSELREVDKLIKDMDRYAAEVAVLTEQLETLRMEQANLAPARQEIEQVKAEAAAAAADKSSLEQELKALRGEADRLRATLDPERVAALKSEIERLQHERDRLWSEFEAAKSDLEAAMRTIAEARMIESRIAVLELQREELETEIGVQQDNLRTLSVTVEEAKTTRDMLQATARESVVQRDEALREAERLRDDISAMKAEIGSLQALRDTLKKGLDLSVNSNTDSSKPLTDEDKEAILRDLIAQPACLRSPRQLRDNRLESVALSEVDQYLRASGLTFDRRTIRAFHTALKVNDTAQLTVLAGVSGTGKSLLPRRYAEAMGIHFLQVAVEPRWDSPQDLLGFYNYVEKKYRATDLSRLLVHMDPWQSIRLPEGTPDKRDHMAMVLLDEMNLARVEYYFSEFLSRLEARPAWDASLAQQDQKGRAKDAMIPVDIRGLDDPPMLFPAHNILFLGTMNDDESTQSLSDKVLDRGNILQFPAPVSFPSPAQSRAMASDTAQSFLEWRSWINPGRVMELPNAVEQAIGELAVIMQDFGKPFGHRMNQSMRAYVAHYPRETTGAVDTRTPLADQVEFRILPKLRGVEIASHPNAFAALDRLLRGSLIGDTKLADRVAETARAQEGTTGLFVWRGMSREG